MAVTIKELTLYWGKDIRKIFYNLRFNEISEHKKRAISFCDGKFIF